MSMTSTAGRLDQPPPADVSKKILSIDRLGHVAVAKLELKEFDWLLDDYMSLLKFDGEWLIVNRIPSRGD